MRKQSLFDTWKFSFIPFIHWAAIGLMVLLAHSGLSYGAGLGRLNVQSQMGQPFSADIELINVSKEELASLQASLAPTAAYEAANLRFDPALNTLRVAVAQRPNGAPYLRVNTWRPVVEPYLDLVIDLHWQGGKIRRAYSALLEPPGLADATTARAPAASAPQAAPPPAAVPAPQAAPRAAPAAKPVPAPAAAVTPAPAPAVPSATRPPAPPPVTQPAAKAVEPAAKPEVVKPKPEPELKPEPKPAEPTKTDAAPVQTPALEAKPEAKAATPASPPPAVAPKTVAPPAPATAQRGWMDTVNDNLMPILGGALALLAGLCGLWAWRRREQAAPAAAEPVAPTLRNETRRSGTPAAATVAGAAAASTAAKTTPATAPTSVPQPTVASVTDIVDPIEEAQVYLEHGQDEQAETILREALAKQPEREDVHLKLLEILATRGDKVAFNRLAGNLHKLTYGRGERWQHAAALGYALDPANPLYPPTHKIVDLPSPREAAAALDVNLESAAAAPDTMGNTTTLLLNKDADKPVDMEKTMVLTRDALQPAASATPAAQPPLDFNFELPPASTPAPAAEAPAAKANKDDNIIDFKVDFPNINLDLDDKPARPTLHEVRDEAWEAVQQKLDLARAYQEMGDKEGALETLDEVLREGGEAHKAEARKMIEALK